MLGPAAVLTNYTITNAGASGTVNVWTAVWMTNPNSKTYGYADPVPLTTGSGDFLVADGVTATYSRAPGETVLAGPYHITATLGPAAVLTNYTITNAGASFTVNARPATWTTNPNSKTYGYADPVPLTTGSGDFLVADGVTATYSRAAGEKVAGGPYPITATLSSATPNALNNYAITNTDADFTITAAPLSVTPADANRLYGDPNPAFTGTLNGIKNGDNITATYGTTATPASPIGPYDITATLLDPTSKVGNYSVTLNKGKLTITQAPLTVTPANANRLYGDANPAFTGTITGIKNGDNITPNYRTSATTGSPIGTYAITPTLNDSTNKLGNYTVTLNSGTLTVNPAPLTVTPANASRSYGSANPAFTGVIVGIKNGDPITASYGTTATQSSNIGTYDITATLSDPVNQ